MLDMSTLPSRHRPKPRIDCPGNPRQVKRKYALRMLLLENICYLCIRLSDRQSCIGGI